jgi:hypothetical protein
LKERFFYVHLAFLKYIISAILILSILSFQFSDLLVYISFKINQDYIAKNLCVEKDIVGSTCKGCCQLKKKLENNAKQKEQVPPAQNSKQNIDFFTFNYLINNYFPLPVEVTKSYLCRLNNYKFLSSIFRPPENIS